MGVMVSTRQRRSYLPTRPAGHWESHSIHETAGDKDPDGVERRRSPACSRHPLPRPAAPPGRRLHRIFRRAATAHRSAAKRRASNVPQWCRIPPSLVYDAPAARKVHRDVQIWCLRRSGGRSADFPCLRAFPHDCSACQESRRRRPGCHATDGFMPAGRGLNRSVAVAAPAGRVGGVSLGRGFSARGLSLSRCDRGVPSV